MMRSPRFFSVAVRRPDGEIVLKSREIVSLSRRFAILRKFALRGVFVLWDTLVLGIEALSFSAQQAAGEEVELGAKEMALSMVFAIVLGVGLFILLPVGLTWTVRSYVGYSYLRSFIEGLLRLAIFLGYLIVVSRLREIRRVFEYHGAEHKAIHTYEAGEPLTPENTAKYSPLHVGCGTAFMLIVMVLAVFIFAFIPRTTYWLRIAIQLVLVPFIAAVSYEIIKLARRREQSRLVKAVMAPGLFLQRLTAREPSPDQIEVAIAALKRVLALESEEESAEALKR